jgi:hypothetical protein
MNNLSTANSTDITSQIGALELGDHLESYGDGVLETAGEVNSGTTYTTCGATRMCRGALELGDHPECYSDGVLEGFGGVSMNPRTSVQQCGTGTTFPGRCIRDGALEAVSHLSPTSAAGGCPTRVIGCR